MVSFYRAGYSLREVSERFKESKSTVHRWVQFAEGQCLERVDFYNKKTGTSQPFNKSARRLERQVLTIRRDLKEKSILGLYGSEAIHFEMIRRGMTNVPTSRTIAHIVKRHGLVDRRVRVRYPSPSPGWYLRDLVSKKSELDRVDIVEKLYLHGGQEVQLLNMISLHGSLMYSVADNVITSEIVVDALTELWQKFGLPRYVPFDNGMFFNVLERRIR
jgi:hypothetical protein